MVAGPPGRTYAEDGGATAAGGTRTRRTDDMLEFRGHGSGIAQAFALEQVARPEQVARLAGRAN